MNNSSGIYQVDGLLKAKLQGSGLEPYVEVRSAHRYRGRKASCPALQAGNLTATIGLLTDPVRDRLMVRAPDSGSGSLGSNPSPAAFLQAKNEGPRGALVVGGSCAPRCSCG